MTFYSKLQSYENFNFDDFLSKVDDNKIEQIINKNDLDELDFLALLSDKARNFLEPLAQKSSQICKLYFGNSITLFAPLYVSNFCINNCVYCGFSTRNNIERKVLSFEQVHKNAEIVSGFGIRHILLLTAESPVKTDLKYLKECVKILKNYFDVIDIELYPLTEDGYKELGEAGVTGITIFQETYDEKNYKCLHTKGAKTDFRFRLETCERAGRAGFRNLSIGALLGLSDFIKDLFFTGLHAKYLQETFRSCDIGVSFPRLRNAVGGYQAKVEISDAMLVQAICAMRLFINRIGITISTRENNELRSNLIPLGITKMSAASNTEVGGYAEKNNTKGQFEISDNASVRQVKEMIYKKGYQPVLKDWMPL
ncbi:MAG: 2-iminoacetate synthase ThiH [Elusimicrobiota bacterium]|jgi:2-iminoacetate synthase|nr:2-iminoacetate synthase ThiH [Elusimicrobiota bacterium]